MPVQFSIFEECHLFARMPVPYDVTILHNNGIENTVFVVGLSAELFCDCMMAALVAYQIFVIGR